MRYRDDDLDYIRATVPIDQAGGSPQARGIQSVNLDEVIPLDDPRPAALRPHAADAARREHASSQPLHADGDTGAAQFMAANPTWDGRGVTIGILDTGVTLDHPSLLTTSTGERKIVDWVTATDPFTDDDPTWVNMKDQVSGRDLHRTRASPTPRPPTGPTGSGCSTSATRDLGGELGSDVNRDGNPAGSSGIFAVLWDTTTNNVYVDSNQNSNFADELAMTDYKVRFDVGYFGVDNPATAVAERMPFVVQTDGKQKVVNIGIVSGAHGSHVAGITAGERLFGGAMSGAAPGAKIVSARACLFIAGCTVARADRGHDLRWPSRPTST